MFYIYILYTYTQCHPHPVPLHTLQLLYRKNMSSNKAGPPKKESILELTKMIDARVHVKCLGGREVVGTLKGYDELVNLVLDDADEYIRGT